MSGDQDLLGFTFVASGDPLVRTLDDSVCHRACLSEWADRDRFVRAWNKEAMYSLGTAWFLDVRSDGKVHYLSGFDRCLNALRLKRSHLLPKHISRRRPLLKLRLTHGCKSPFTLKYNFSSAHSWPTAQQLGVSNDLADAIQEWVAQYHNLCETERTDEATVRAQWAELPKLGRDLWHQLCDEIGNRYRIVYLESGRIWEPEERDEPADAPESPIGSDSSG